jgi:hypothetical protein
LQQVGLHCGFGQVQGPGDLLVAVPAGDRGEHLGLPAGQHGARLAARLEKMGRRDRLTVDRHRIETPTAQAGRDTLAAVSAAGFTIDRLERFAFPDTPLPHPAAAHVLGTAIRHGNGQRS